MRPRLLPLLFTLPLALIGCRSQSQPPAPVPPQPAAAPAAVRSPFDGDTAYSLLKAQCALGPRPPLSLAHDRCKAMILKELTPNVDEIVKTNFTFRDSSRRVTLPLTNILGVINPKASKKIMLFTHWDTRPTADQDVDSPGKPILGADDGASGTAVLLELARLFHEKRPDVCVELLFVDGEDWGPGEDKMYLGSIQFARHPGAYRPDAAILLDMIGDKDLDIHREKQSEAWSPDLNNKVWAAASALGYAAQFPNDAKWAISDDHVPFHQAGIPTVDLIDFDYPHWHTLQDTADKCSPQSLKAVGDVMAKVIYDER